MKTVHIRGILILLFSLLVFALAISNFNQTTVFAQHTDAIVALQQATPTPPVGDQSEIGSTDGILIMGIAIVVIVITPLLFLKKKKP